MENQQTALARREPVKEVTAIVQGGLVRNIAEMRARLDAVENVAIVLMPEVNISALPPLYALQPHAVYMSVDPAARDVYTGTNYLRADECALTKTGLLRLMMARGLSVVSSAPSSPEQYLWRHDVLLKGQQLDGQWTIAPGHKEVDLRDGAADALRMKPNELRNARVHGASNAETKALLRAIRLFLMIPQKFQIETLRTKPFVFATLVPDLDMGDPEQKRAALAMVTGSTAALYGAGPTPRATAPVLPPGSEGNPRMLAEPSDPEEDSVEGVVVDDEVPLEAEAERYVCDCPCGDQSEVDAATAQRRLESIGNVRCTACFPSRTFAFGGDRHPEDMDLRVKKHEGLTPVKLRARLAAAARK